MPKIEVKSYPEGFVVGLVIHTQGMSAEIPKLWEKLAQHESEIEDLDETAHVAYGISIMGPDWAETHAFDYLAGMPVKGEPTQLPEGMASFKIHAGEYVMVRCPNLASIQQGYEALYNRWLPQSDYQIDISGGNFCFELYGEEYNPSEGSEIFHIYVPVLKK